MVRGELVRTMDCCITAMKSGWDSCSKIPKAGQTVRHWAPMLRLTSELTEPHSTAMVQRRVCTMNCCATAMGQFDEVSLSFLTGVTLEHTNGGTDGTTLDCDCAVGKDVGLLGE